MNKQSIEEHKTLNNLKRVQNIMRIMLFFFIFCISASQATNGFSQETKVSLNMKATSIGLVCTEIERQSDYIFVFSDHCERVLDKQVDIAADSKNIDEVLDAVFAKTGLTYKVLDKQIIVYESERAVASKNSNDATAIEVSQQKKVRITGTVADAQGELLIGANVIEKGTTNGTVTDVDGKFSLVIDADALLQVSYIGYLVQDVKTKDKVSFSIVLLEDTQVLEEFVITGVVNKRKESFTGSSATYTAEDLRSVGTQNAIASLRTLDPTFNVLESTEFGSDPNRMPDIEIRGKSSLISTRDELSENPNQPLFILDGFESSLEAIYNIDMNRIASMTILKDAASTAIYGSKASNGVVVVETIKPKAGKLNLSYNGSANVSWADLTSYNLMNSREKLEFEKMAGRYAGNSTENEVLLDQLYNNKLADVIRGVDTYWLAEPIQTGVNHRHSVYANGGEGAFQFGIGVSYNGITGVMKESDRSNISEHIDLTYRLDKFQFSNKFSMDNTKSSNPIVGYSGYANANPYYTKFNDDGEVDKWLEYNDFIKASNPLYNAAQNSYNTSGSFNVSNKFMAEYSPINEIKARARFGITHINSNSEAFTSPLDSRFSNEAYTKRGSYGYGETQSNKYEGEFTLTYGKLFNEVHLLNIATGGYLSQQDSKYHGYSAVGFPVGDYTLPSFANGYPEGGNPSYNENSSRSVSGYAIGNYAFDNRYLLDFSYRINGSSIFGVQKKYIGTWALGTAWNIHREAFVKDNIDGISMFKIRASMGNPGNQNFSSSATLTTFQYNFNMLNYFGMTTSLAQLGNPDLEWQTTLDRNIGFDITVLDDRLSIVGDYYNKSTDPLLIGIATPSSTGATGNIIYKNFGNQKSKGFTLQSTYYIIRDTKERFWWSVRGSVRNGSNTLQGIGNRLDIFNTEGKVNKSTKRYFDGADPDDIWAVRSAGIDPASGKEIFIKKDGELSYDFSYDDEVIIGSSRPKAEGILGSNLSWRGFSVNFDFRYRLGGYTFNSAVFNKVENISASQLQNNQDKRALYDRWQKPGDKAQFKNIANSLSTPMSSRFIQKENTLSLESFRVGYEFHPETAQKFGASSLRLNAYMNDIFRLSTVKTERGISYPFSRSVSVSLSLTL